MESRSLEDEKTRAKRLLEEGSVLSMDFGKLSDFFDRTNGTDAVRRIIPVAVQHADTKEVLIVAYADEAALYLTLQKRIAVLYSTSRNELWAKGATSGDMLTIVDVLVNCDQNSLVYLGRPVRKGACHTKDASGATRGSCYYRVIVMVNSKPMLLRYNAATG
jgi:phosphoribosyl-AMP cyclohydrolase